MIDIPGLRSMDIDGILDISHLGDIVIRVYKTKVRGNGYV